MKVRNELSAREVTALQTALKRRLGDTSVPTLPEVAMRVVQMVSDPNASLSDFSRVIKTDQALTGRLLRTANSASYAQRQPVTDLRRAMVLMGLERIKAMALGFHLSQTAGGDESAFSNKRIWTRSLFRAWLSFRLADRFDKSRAGEAFIIGLMLDAGLPMMPKLLGARYEQLISPDDPPRKQYRIESMNLPFTHQDVTAALSDMWRFPPALAKPLCLRYVAATPVNKKSPETLLHTIANYVGALRLDNVSDDSPPDETLAVMGERLFGLDSTALQRIVRDAANDFKGSRELFKDMIDETLSIEQILASANQELNEVVEEFVEGSIENEEDRHIRRFDVGGLILEIEPAANRKIVVYIADESGKRLLSEEISPRDKSTAELRQMLMLDSTDEGLFDEVIGHIRSLAA